MAVNAQECTTLYDRYTLCSCKDPESGALAFFATCGLCYRLDGLENQKLNISVDLERMEVDCSQLSAHGRAQHGPPTTVSAQAVLAWCLFNLSCTNLFCTVSLLVNSCHPTVLNNMFFLL